MDAADSLLATGIAHHQAGRAEAARRCYDALLGQDSCFAERLHQQGAGCLSDGDPAGAVQALAVVVALLPDVAQYHHDLGLACGAAGQPAWAERCLARAVELEPGNAASHYNLGAIRLRLGDPRAAQAPLCAALTLSPRAADAHALFGVALLRIGRFAAARVALQRALAMPHATQTAHGALGMLLAGLGCLATAEHHYRAALCFAPHDPVLWDNLGNLLRDACRLGEAEAAFARSIQLRPGRAEAHTGMGNVLTAAGRVAEADQSYRTALAIDPGHAPARYNQGNLHLLTGRFREGWAGFEWRWRRPGFQPPPRLPQPRWTGAPTGDAPLLLHAEQGFGDTIMMARYIPAIAANSRVILQVQPGLERLLASLPGTAGVFARGDALPPFGQHCPLMSLPQVLGTRPAESAYLQADSTAVATWRRRMRGLARCRVGLAWAGNPLYPADARRSIPPGALAALRAIQGVALVSLQKDGRAPLPLHDWTADLRDFADTAALIMALDLVIAADTAVAHLAGALGKPVWLLNRYDPCWRWQLQCTDSPWYPTLRQFRQPSPGDWYSVLANVRAALETDFIR
jgi:Flp pilus assembly protein TadD